MAEDDARQGWFAVVQEADGSEETEVVTLEFREGTLRTIEMTNGQRITLTMPAGRAA